MRSVRNRGLAWLMIASLFVSALPARAGIVRGAPPAGSAIGARTPRADSGTGVVAAIGCGLGARFFPAVIVGGPGWTATWVGACLLMVIDAMAEED